MMWGLALLGAPTAALPYVAGVGGAFIAYCLAPLWLTPLRGRWQRRWQIDEQERQRRWAKRLDEWRNNLPP
jgi:hypothetical protein